ncbi:MAG: glycosyl hydrolase family 88 [Rhodocyclales bacterium]|nr:glycosyl hydrolase family 88 [Rhodocyclales bacterium]
MQQKGHPLVALLYANALFDLTLSPNYMLTDCLARSARLVIVLSMLTLTAPAISALPTKAAVLSSVSLVDDYWISEHSNVGSDLWNNAVYHIGNLAAWSATNNAAYLNHATNYAQKYNWLIYGNTWTTHADNYAIGQVYLGLTSDAAKLANTKLQTDAYFKSSGYDSKWTWIDAYFMQSTVFTKLGNLYGNVEGADYHLQEWKMFDFMRTSLKLYDAGSTNLWFRDDNYIYPWAKSPNGKKVLWSRGNGWVFAALASNLELLPTTAPNYDIYKSIYLNMAAALIARQRPDGFWNTNLDDPEQYGGPETSGTAAFTYGMAIGIRKGWLDSATYMPVVENAWNGMVSKAVQPNGFLGYVQGIGKAPGSTSNSTTADFGVGLFLLAGSEVFKLALP